VAGDALLVPTGRSVPAAFDTAGGAFRYYHPSVHRFNGGHWITSSQGLVFNPRRSDNPDIDVHLGPAEPSNTAGLAAYAVANGGLELDGVGLYRLVVRGGMVYASSAQGVQAIDLGYGRAARSSTAR